MPLLTRCPVIALPLLMVPSLCSNGMLHPAEIRSLPPASAMAVEEQEAFRLGIPAVEGWERPTGPALAAPFVAVDDPVPGESGARWLPRIERYLAEREYEASRNHQGLQAPNRAHDLRTYFGPAGIRVVDRTTAEGPALIELRAACWGRPDRMSPVEPGEVSHERARVEIRRPGLVEWYENSPAGLEQGFTVADSPAGTGPLVLTLEVRGAEATSEAGGVTFRSANGRSLAYGKLAVFDANGASLAGRLETDASEVRIVVDDRGADYPVTIDPLLTSTADGRLESNQGGAQLGISVAGAGDVNGDGYADVIAGAHGYDAGETDEGAAFVYLGSANGIPTGSPAHAMLQSNQAGARMGIGVAGAGDVNGDGYSDVIVGADSFDSPEINEGAAFVFLGSAAGIANGSPATAAATLQSNQMSALMGFKVAGAGDVNGDGHADVIVGAYRYDAGETDEGAAFVFHGSPAGVANGSPASAAATLQSNQANAWMGFSVAGAGDVNGDGHADVIVGALLYDAGETDEGAALTFLGSAAGIASGNPTSPGVATLESNQASAQLGYSVAGAGDVNGDGYADVIVGAPVYDAGETDEGAAFVFLGGAAGVASSNPASPAVVTLQSNQASAQMGISVAGAGDVDGDGYADAIVGVHSFDSPDVNEGAAFVFLGSAVGIATTRTATLESNQAGANLGGSVTGAGDVNGDGFADVMVGASGYDSPETNEGATFVYLGGARGIVGGRVRSLFQSDQAEASMGFSVAGAGDVNGDGHADVIVGARGYDAGEVDEGAAFMFLGSAAGIASGSPASAAATLQSNQTGAYMGHSVAGAGDVNGDGYADVIVGAPLFDTGANDEGAAFVFLGSPSGIASGSPAAAAAMIESNQAKAYMGISVAGAGDVNGDGFADVIVGAQEYDGSEIDEGAAFVFLGSPSGISSGDPSTAAATLESNQAGAVMGASVAGAGDVNGDGYADVIVGAWAYGAGQPDEGAAFVFLGSPTGIANGTPATAAATLESNQAYATMGTSVAGAGDVNGDGYADVIVGANYYYDAGEMNEGAAFVFLGSATGVASGSPATAATMLQSNQSFAYMGGSVAGAGDVNGDGYADVIVGASFYSDFVPSEGAAFVFLGSAAGVTSGSPAVAAATLQSIQSNARMGNSVAGAGDVNGDGYADVIIGAFQYDNGDTNEGAAFLHLGGGGTGRTVLSRQLRGDGSGRQVASWGRSQAPDRFQLQMNAVDPGGRGRVKLEAEYCPPGRPFGSIDCGRAESPAWIDVGAISSGVTLISDVVGTSSTLYRWRVRTLRAPFTVTLPGITAPPRPAHGPWRRFLGQAFEADIRTLSGPVAVPPGEGWRGLVLAPISTPARGSIALSLSLAGDDGARIELLDVAGRRVRSRDLGAGGPRPRMVRLSEPGELPSGIYLVRLTQGRRTAVAKVVLVN